MRIVLDTNVLVSGLISPFGPPARVLEMILTGDLTLVFDDRILAEYRQVLARERFGLNADDVADLLRYFEAAGEHVTARPAFVTLPDPDDLSFLEVALAARVDALITGNTRYYPHELSGHRGAFSGCFSRAFDRVTVCVSARSLHQGCIALACLYSEESPGEADVPRHSHDESLADCAPLQTWYNSPTRYRESNYSARL